MSLTSLHVDSGASWRGGQNQVRLTVRGLQAAGHRAVLMGHAKGELVRRLDNSTELRTFEPRSEMDVQAAWTLGGAIAEVEPDVVHAHDAMSVSLTAMALQMRGTRERRPLVVGARRVDFHLKQHAFSRWKYRQVDVFIAASRLIAGMLEHDGIERQRIEVVHDGVDVAAIDAADPVDAHAAFWLPHGAPLVGNVAALAGHKGQRHLIAAAALVIRELPDVRFLIVGDGELRAPLDHQIKSLGLERHVFLTGFRADAIGLLKSFDVFVMSSVTEGLGSAILEAMACGRAVIGSRTGGIPEAVEDGETGALVSPGHEPELAEAIVTLLSDPVLRNRYGAAGRTRVVAEFSVEKLVEGTVRVYESRVRSLHA
jgi:L-malate glycosyltransferase